MAGLLRDDYDLALDNLDKVVLSCQYGLKKAYKTHGNVSSERRKELYSMRKLICKIVLGRLSDEELSERL